jgi:hypothetical protein
MRRALRDAEHLFRVLGLFLVGLLAFMGLQALMVPKGFGALGHYRPGALEDNRARALAHAGRAACAECHDEPAARLKTGKHARIGCEACHGPQGVHASGPDEANKPPRPNPATLCVTCHLANVGRPAAFPQVQPKEHAPEGTCGDCHQPHNPALAPGEKP